MSGRYWMVPDAIGKLANRPMPPQIPPLGLQLLGVGDVRDSYEAGAQLPSRLSAFGQKRSFADYYKDHSSWPFICSRC
jgi:hypothetical protein